MEEDRICSFDCVFNDLYNFEKLDEETGTKQNLQICYVCLVVCHQNHENLYDTTDADQCVKIDNSKHQKKCECIHQENEHFFKTVIDQIWSENQLKSFEQTQLFNKIQNYRKDQKDILELGYSEQFQYLENDQLSLNNKVFTWFDVPDNQVVERVNVISKIAKFLNKQDKMQKVLGNDTLKTEVACELDIQLYIKHFSLKKIFQYIQYPNFNFGQSIYNNSMVFYTHLIEIFMIVHLNRDLQDVINQDFCISQGNIISRHIKELHFEQIREQFNEKYFKKSFDLFEFCKTLLINFIPGATWRWVGGKHKVHVYACKIAKICVLQGIFSQKQVEEVKSLMLYKVNIFRQLEDIFRKDSSQFSGQIWIQIWNDGMASIRESYSAVFLYDYIRQLDRKIIDMIDNDSDLKQVRLYADSVQDVDLSQIDKLYQKTKLIESTMITDRQQLQQLMLVFFDFSARYQYIEPKYKLQNKNVTNMLDVLCQHLFNIGDYLLVNIRSLQQSMVEYQKTSFNDLINEVCIEQEDNSDLEDELEYMKFQYDKGTFSYIDYLKSFNSVLGLIIECNYEISTISFNKLDRAHCLDILPCYRMISSPVLDDYRSELLEIEQKYIQIQNVLFQKGVVYYAIKLANYQKYDIHDSELFKIDVFDKKVNLILDQNLNINKQKKFFNGFKCNEFNLRHEQGSENQKLLANNQNRRLQYLFRYFGQSIIQRNNNKNIQNFFCGHQQDYDMIQYSSSSMKLKQTFQQYIQQKRYYLHYKNTGNQEKLKIYENKLNHSKKCIELCNFYLFLYELRCQNNEITKMVEFNRELITDDPQDECIYEDYPKGEDEEQVNQEGQLPIEDNNINEIKQKEEEDDENEDYEEDEEEENHQGEDQEEEEEEENHQDDEYDEEEEEENHQDQEEEENHQDQEDNSKKMSYSYLNSEQDKKHILMLRYCQDDFWVRTSFIGWIVNYIDFKNQLQEKRNEHYLNKPSDQQYEEDFYYAHFHKHRDILIQEIDYLLTLENKEDIQLYSGLIFGGLLKYYNYIYNQVDHKILINIDYMKNNKIRDEYQVNNLLQEKLTVLNDKLGINVDITQSTSQHSQQIEDKDLAQVIFEQKRNLILFRQKVESNIYICQQLLQPTIEYLKQNYKSYQNREYMMYVPSLAFLKSLYKTPYNQDHLLSNEINQKIPSELMKSEFYKPNVSQQKYELLIKNYIRKEIKMNPELNIYSVLFLYHKLKFMGPNRKENEIVNFINENKNGFMLQLIQQLMRSFYVVIKDDFKNNRYYKVHWNYIVKIEMFCFLTKNCQDIMVRSSMDKDSSVYPCQFNQFWNLMKYSINYCKSKNNYDRAYKEKYDFSCMTLIFSQLAVQNCRSEYKQMYAHEKLNNDSIQRIQRFTTIFQKMTDNQHWHYNYPNDELCDFYASNRLKLVTISQLIFDNMAAYVSGPHIDSIDKIYTYIYDRYKGVYKRFINNINSRFHELKNSICDFLVSMTEGYDEKVINYMTVNFEINILSKVMINSIKQLYHFHELIGSNKKQQNTHFSDLQLKLDDIQKIMDLYETNQLFREHPLMAVFMKTYVLIKRLSNRNYVMDLYLTKNGQNQNNQTDNVDTTAVQIAQRIFNQEKQYQVLFDIEKVREKQKLVNESSDKTKKEIQEQINSLKDNIKELEKISDNK